MNLKLSNPIPKENIVLVDGHIHIHNCFDLNFLFDSAYKNFRKAAELFNAEHFEGVLCLTENFNVDYFSKLKRMVEGNQGQVDSLAWKFYSTNEPNSIRILRNQDELIYVFAGRQIVTKEKLEVLAIGLINNIENGKPIDQVLKFVKENNALPIIPWGAGKWIGNRKKIIEELISEYRDDSLFLGDNGNRPYLWMKPSIFKRAEKLNIRNLQGTDPFPFESEVSKAGSYGLGIEGTIDPQNPFENIKKTVLNLNVPLLHFGKSETTLRFFRNQFLMHLSKHKKTKFNNNSGK